VIDPNLKLKPSRHRYDLEKHHPEIRLCIGEAIVLSVTTDILQSQHNIQRVHSDSPRDGCLRLWKAKHPRSAMSVNKVNLH
jgi:hypothetical protein